MTGPAFPLFGEFPKERVLLAGGEYGAVRQCGNCGHDVMTTPFPEQDEMAELLGDVFDERSSVWLPEIAALLARIRDPS